MMPRTRDRWEAERQQGQLLLPIFQPALRLRLLKYWEAAADKEGYADIKDAIVGIYRETSSTAETARRLTFTRRCISRKLKELKEPVNGPGGANNPYGRAGKPGNDRDGT